MHGEVGGWLWFGSWRVDGWCSGWLGDCTQYVRGAVCLLFGYYVVIGNGGLCVDVVRADDLNEGDFYPDKQKANVRSQFKNGWLGLELYSACMIWLTTRYYSLLYLGRRL
jgi:hypothetical protein